MTMSENKNRRIVLASRPEGEPKPEHFRLETAAIPEPKDGEVLLRNLWMSLDPYMRGRMSAAKSYAKPVEIGQPMVAGTVSEVVKSKRPDYAPGDIVLSYTGWMDYAVSNGSDLRKLDPKQAPVQTALGVLGMPGMTAYLGMKNIGMPKEGETVVVAAASGPVGSFVGQYAKIKGCRAVGVAGGADKCRYVVEELGFDACVDHRDPDLPQKLAAACPKGIDVYFENVGGKVFDAVFPLLNQFGRMPVCGIVSHYNDTVLPPGPDRTGMLLGGILRRSLTLRGFIVWDFAAQAPDFYREAGQWVREGRIKYREDVVNGLENAPEAFMGLLKGKNFGKLLVKIA
ncbi:MAG: NADP-dependent oxidoreductase [Rhizobiales bacterium]|nr:NADP-dependent oxidoreductase [Hyphomicrobiales bacterium]